MNKLRTWRINPYLDPTVNTGHYTLKTENPNRKSSNAEQPDTRQFILYLNVSPKNPNNFCAFDVTLFMCEFQVMLVEIVTPSYFAVSTDSRVCPFKM
jgi:hypothetical protein